MTRRRSRPFRALRAPAVGIALLAMAATALVGCSQDVPTEYSAQNTDDFFAACTDATTDSVLHTRLCQCVIDELTTQLDFDEFAALDAAMAADPPPATSAVILDVVADCVIEVGNL